MAQLNLTPIIILNINMDCVKCNNTIKRNEDVSCGKCKQVYHFACLGMTEAQYKGIKADKSKQFQCSLCAEIRSSSEDGRNNSVIIQEMNRKLNTLSSQMVEMNGKMSTLLEENKRLKNELTCKDKDIQDLQHRVNYLEQRTRINNLEIANFPETRNLETREIIKKIFVAVGVKITDADIQAVHRVPKFNSGVKNIIVNFTSRWTRNKILMAYKQFRSQAKWNLLAKDIEANLVDTPVYISEHLSPAYKKLLAKAKQIAKEKKIKYVWIKEGQILMKRDDGDKVARISNEKDLSNYLK